MYSFRGSDWPPSFPTLYVVDTLPPVVTSVYIVNHEDGGTNPSITFLSPHEPHMLSEPE